MLYHPILLYFEDGMDSGICMLDAWYILGRTMLCQPVHKDRMDSGISIWGTRYTVGSIVCSPRAQDPGLTLEGGVMLWLQSWVNKALNTNSWLFFSFLCFGFRTSVSLLRFPHYSVFHLPQMINSLNMTGVYIRLIYSTLPISMSNVIIHLHCIWVVTAQRSGAYQLFGGKSLLI